MAAPPITERHLPHFHRRAPMKEAVRTATTASITISTALNNGDTLDGLTLATGDRVLVKDQSTGSQNGIYVVGVTPVRDYDESTDDPAFGYLVYVREGTANGGTLWKNTNTATPTIDSTSLTFAQFTSGFTDPMTTRGDIIVRNASNVTARLARGSADTYLGSDGTDVAFSAVTDAKLSTSDITTNNASTSKHGFLKKLDNDSTHFMDGTGAWAVPTGSGTGTVTTVEEVDGSPTDSAVTKIVFPNGTLGISGHVATYTPASSGNITQAYVGYNTIGASFETSASNSKVYAKQVVLANDCLLTSIGCYLQSAAGTSSGPAAGVFTDSGGHPLMFIGGESRSVLLSLNANGARWVDIPVGIWLVAGTYWIAVRLVDIGAAVVPQIAYDTGTDETRIAAQNDDWQDWTGGTTTARKFSIRGNTIR